MCARSFSSRRTNPFSAMICMNFRMVLYCAVRRRLMTLWISRTVAGPVDHSTVRISSSASVGLGGSAAIYEDFTSKIFVCQGGGKRGVRHRFLWSRLSLVFGREKLAARGYSWRVVRKGCDRPVRLAPDVVIRSGGLRWDLLARRGVWE